CGMSLELTGTRVLAPILGVSLFTWTGVIGVMLAGTACGNYLGGVLADRGVGPALRRFAILIGAIIGAATGPLIVWRCLEQFNPDEKEWIEYSVRLLGASIGVIAVLPGAWLSKRRWGAYLNSVLVGGLIGTVFAHSVGRAISAGPLDWSFSIFGNPMRV